MAEGETTRSSGHIPALIHLMTLMYSASLNKDGPMSQHLRVLVADDEPLIRALVAIAFEAEGYDVDTAADGAEALEKACHQPPQAIVLDLMMPVMDGWDFLAAWQCQSASQAVPIVVMSAGHLQAEPPS